MQPFTAHSGQAELSPQMGSAPWPLLSRTQVHVTLTESRHWKRQIRRNKGTCEWALGSLCSWLLGHGPRSPPASPSPALKWAPSSCPSPVHLLEGMHRAPKRKAHNINIGLVDFGSFLKLKLASSRKCQAPSHHLCGCPSSLRTSSLFDINKKKCVMSGCSFTWK